MTKFKINHSRIGKSINANDIFDIATELMLWGDDKEWGTIKAPSFYLTEKEYLTELKKQGFTITIKDN